MGQPVWHIQGVLPIREPDGSTYRRRTHFVATKAKLAVGILQQNFWMDAVVFVVLPPALTASRRPEIATCTALWECCDRDDASAIGCGFDTELGSFADPSDGLSTDSMVKGKTLWSNFGRAEPR